ncbi:sodium:solute symporter family transporter [Morganella morganii]|uniref:sodium:solute symporter family transporter n=1 Tax=Morganella morganii TaxID=582 RepID=UPI0021D370D4|nr:Na+:solute symporter [Morganella morganii]MCU6353614.1 Na+:solute symporter [Morganella morganii]
MQTPDWITLTLFFIIMIGIGLNAYRRVKGTNDFYVAGGGLPWWLAGISHHVSGYSGVVFTGYAALAYATGFNLYVWWALNVTIACLLGAWLIVPRWARLRDALQVQSPTEYLKIRYDVKTQQVIAWLGVLLKLLDTAGKYAAIGVLFYGFTGIPVIYGVLISGVVAMIYVTVGGLWADTMNDFFQFLVGIAAGIIMFFVVQSQLGDIGTNYLDMWDRLPAGNSDWFNGQYSPLFFASFAFVCFLSYNGGTWNLASRFIASPDGKQARRAMILSASLYLVWPLILFAPMWAAPLLIPDVPADQQTQIYSMLTLKYLPLISKKVKRANGETPLWMARTVTFTFTLCTIVLALNQEHFGGIIGLIVVWFGGLIGPASIPMVLGLLPFYKHCGPKIAITSMLIGLAVFAGTKLFVTAPSMALSVGGPVFCSLVFFTLAAIAARKNPVKPEVDALMHKLSRDGGN